ncbi:MAG: hypothetical protein RI968_1060 [Pseudomonadota bacterium]|jgi:outer membrane protein assembly factor BamC
MTRFRNYCLIALSASALSGCGILPGKDIDYQSAKKRETPLEVPPDLIRPAKDDRFAIPASGTASRSEFERGQSAPRVASASTVLPSIPGMRLDRIGDQQSLVVKQAPEKLWPVLRQFWIDNGFAIAVESPETGVMETDWAENRAKIPDDFLRRTLGKVFDRLYDTGERDRFRMRLDRLPNGEVEITLAHRGLIEVAKSGSSDSGFTWTNRPADRQLEGDFLRRIMLRLGADENKTREVIAQAANTAPLVQITKTDKQSQIEVTEPFDRAWRRVGVAIDRLGFTVEDRDRTKGLFFVRYRDPTADVTSEKGFFGRLFSSKPSDQPIQYQIVVAAEGERSMVRIRNQAGAVVNDAAAQRVLSVLFDQLK